MHNVYLLVFYVSVFMYAIYVAVFLGVAMFVHEDMCSYVCMNDVQKNINIYVQLFVLCMYSMHECVYECMYVCI